jgi:osmotically-inducible protein OsmY
MRNRELIVRAGALVLAAAILTVPAPAKAKPDNAELSKIVEAKISSKMTGRDVQVTVNRSVVTLDGTVANIDQKEWAAKTVSKLEGVEAVNNNLRITTDINGNRIAEEASRQVRCYAYFTIFDDVQLEAVGGKLTLSGQVLTPTRKNDIGALMKGVAGVREIQNDLEVLPLSSYDDAIRLRVARAI